MTQPELPDPPSGRAARTDAAGEEILPAPELEGAVVEADTRSAGAPPGDRWAVPLGLRYMALGALAFSVMSLLVKVVGQRLPSQEIVFFRAVVTLVLSYWGVRAARVDAWGTNRRLLVLRGLIGFVALSAFYYAVIHLPLADATVIQYTNPVFATLLATRALGERLRLREVGTLVVSMVGVVIVTRPSFLFGGESALPLLAAGIGLVGAVASGTAYVSVRKLRATEHPMVIVFYFALVSVICSMPLAAPGALLPTPTEWVLLLAIGATTHVGQVAITRGLHMERAGRATAVGYLQIVFAATWGALAFGDHPDVSTILGALLIVASTLALSRGSSGEPEAARRD